MVTLNFRRKSLGKTYTCMNIHCIGALRRNVQKEIFHLQFYDKLNDLSRQKMWSPIKIWMLQFGATSPLQFFLPSLHNT